MMRVVVLGRVGIVRDGLHHDVGRPQTRSILALLAINVGEPVAVEAIERALWRGAEPATARAQVQNAVSSLRRTFSRVGSPHVIVSGRYGYQLSLPTESIDLSYFDALVRRARGLGGHDVDAAATVLREALALWRGLPLADATGAFVDGTRTELEERRLLAMEELADVELGRHRPAAVVAELIRQVEAYPLRESLRMRLMRALRECGRHAEALQSFRTYRGLLAEREGLDPGGDISRLAVQILRGGSTDNRQPDEPAGDQPAGGADTRSDVVSRATAAPAQLPAGVPGFIGRVDHLDELDAITAAGSGRLVVVSGMAGVGKTAFATHWARRVIDKFPDGQLFVDLRGFAREEALEPITALARFLRALGQPSEAIPPDVDEAAALYRSLLARRRVLVLLDNASGPEQVRPLLPGSAACLTVVTSRDNLAGLVACDGAHRIVLDVLAPAESAQLLTGVLGQQSVDGATVTALATACGHVPLALRLLAANLAESTGVRPPPAGRNASALLALMQVEGDPRASVRAALDVSYHALPADTQRLFRTLGGVPGDTFSTTLAADLLDSDTATAFDGMATLARYNLTHRVDDGRYALHDLVRLYATTLFEQDGPDERAAAAERMYRSYLAALGAAAVVLYPQTLRIPLPAVIASTESRAAVTFADGPAALAWVDAELPNLVAAARHAAERGPRPMAWLIADVLRGYFWIRRYTTEWIAVAQAGVDAAERESNLLGLAAARLSLGLAYRCLSRYEDAAAELDRSLTACQTIGWPEGVATTLAQLAIVHAELGRTLHARDCLVDALAVNRRLGRTGSEAVVLGNLASVRIRTGELDQALSDSTEALKLYREVGTTGGEAITLTNLGLIHFYLGHFAAANDNATAGLALQRQIGDRYGQTISLTLLAYLRSEQGRHREATDYANEALDVARDTGDRQDAAYALITLGHIQSSLGATDQALTYYTRGGEMARATGDRLPEIEALIGEAQARLDLGDVEAGRDLAEHALRRSDDYGFALLGGLALAMLAAVHLAAAEHDQALEVAMRALTRHQETGHLPGEARTHHILSKIRRAQGDLTGAALAWDSARALYAQIGLAGLESRPSPGVA